MRSRTVANLKLFLSRIYRYGLLTGDKMILGVNLFGACTGLYVHPRPSRLLFFNFLCPIIQVTMRLVFVNGISNTSPTAGSYVNRCQLQLFKYTDITFLRLIKLRV